MSINQLKRGDHIYISRLTCDHHGIYLGNEQVIDYCNSNKSGKTANVIRIRSLQDFLQGQKELWIKKYAHCESPEQTIQKAKSRLGEYKYCIFQNNCEHFAYWCKTGVHKSDQVKNVRGVAIGSSGGAATKIAAKVAYSGAKQAAQKSLNPFAKVAVNLGLKQAPKVAGRAAGGIAGVGGLATGFVTDYAVNQVLEDDKHLTEKERDARKAGRAAASISTTVGSVGGGIAAFMMGGGLAVGAAVAAPAILGVAAAAIVYQLGKDEDIKVTIE
jgi:hypothetical protein